MHSNHPRSPMARVPVTLCLGMSLACMGATCDDNPPIDFGLLTAHAGVDQAVVLGNTVILDGSASRAADDTPLSYEWTLRSGPAAVIIDAHDAVARFNPGAAGVYEFSLSVRNDGGLVDADTVLVTVIAPAAPQLILARSTFDGDTEGWGVSNNGSAVVPEWRHSGGRPNGMIRVSFYPGSVGYFDAPPKFLGNQSAAHRGRLSFDVRASRTDRNSGTGPAVILTGVGIVLVVEAPYRPGTGWTSYSFALDASAGWTNHGTGQPATEADIQALLASIIQMRIRGDYDNDWGHLDNVLLEGPASLP